MQATPSNGDKALAANIPWLAITSVWIVGVSLSWNPTAAAQVMAAVFIPCAVAHAVFSYSLKDAIAFFVICNTTTFAMPPLRVFRSAPIIS